MSGIARFPVSLISHCGQTGIETGKGLARQDFPASRRNPIGRERQERKCPDAALGVDWQGVCGMCEFVGSVKPHKRFCVGDSLTV